MHCPPYGVGPPDLPRSGLDLYRLDQMVQTLLGHGLASRTLCSYRTGVGRYLQFCTNLNLAPFPLSQSSLYRFVAYLYSLGLSSTTIRGYLSGVRFRQISLGGPDPSSSNMPQLQYVLWAIQRTQPPSSRTSRLPMTPAILRLLYQYWASPPVTYTYHMLWAACCLGLFVFLRSGEFTCPSASAYTPFMLSSSDITVDRREHPSMLHVTLRSSKTDVFHSGHTLVVGATGDSLCPVAAVLGYLALRSHTDRTLFIHADGTPLSRTTLVREIQSALSATGSVDVSHYNGHSFQIGAATTTTRMGVPDSIIQIMG